MEIKPVETKLDYERALKEIEALVTARAQSPEGDRLDVRVKLVEAYGSPAYVFMPHLHDVVPRHSFKRRLCCRGNFRPTTPTG